MICTKCGKKIEYETPTCKYCKEPVVLEGCSPMGDIKSIAPEPRPHEAVSAVHYEMPMQRAPYKPQGIGFKKFIPLIVGGTCALVLLVVAVFIGIPSKKTDTPSTSQITKKEESRTVNDVYNTILKEAEETLNAKLNPPEGENPSGSNSSSSTGEGNEGENLPEYIEHLIPYLQTQGQ